MHLLRLLTLVIGAGWAGTAAMAACSADRVELRGDWGKARFSVEVADNMRERSKGLMDRPSMPLSAGMLFIYHRTAPVSFWMKNTLIPLDMLFVDESGVIVGIHHEAQPLDLRPIGSGAPVRYVLEINGGLSRRLGISEGSELRHPGVLQHRAVWPCTDE